MGADLVEKWIKSNDVGKYDWTKKDVEHMSFKEADGLQSGGGFPNQEWMADTLLAQLKVPVLKPFGDDCRVVYCLDYNESVRFVDEIKRLAVLSIQREDDEAKKELNSIFGEKFCNYYKYVPEKLCSMLIEAKTIRDALEDYKDCSCILEVWY